jgi:hypothetical protein
VEHQPIKLDAGVAATGVPRFGALERADGTSQERRENSDNGTARERVRGWDGRSAREGIASKADSLAKDVKRRIFGDEQDIERTRMKRLLERDFTAFFLFLRKENDLTSLLELLLANPYYTVFCIEMLTSKKHREYVQTKLDS